MNEQGYPEYIHGMNISNAKFPRKAEGIVNKKQRNDKKYHADGVNVSAVLVGDKLYLKAPRFRAEFMIADARKYGAADITCRIDLGIGITTDEARYLCDAVREIWQREDLPQMSIYGYKPMIRNI